MLSEIGIDMSYIVGIDIGGSTTKIIGMSGDTMAKPVKVRASDPITSAYGAFGRFLTENALHLEDVQQVMFTGVGSSFINQGLFGIRSEKVDEFLAIGRGGKYLTHMERCIVVSMGTGTALVGVEGGNVTHLGGTGVGGGTLMALADKLLGVHSFSHLMELARNGNLSKVDLTIGDITEEGSLSNMGADITASNLGNISDTAAPADLAMGIVNLVYQSIGMFAVFAAQAREIGDIVLTGNLSTIDFVGPLVFDRLEELYPVRFIKPDQADFATAIGAALSARAQR